MPLTRPEIEALIRACDEALQMDYNPDDRDYPALIAVIRARLLED